MLQKQMLLCRFNLQKLSRKQSLWWRKGGSKGLVFLLASLIFLSGFGGFLGLLTAQTGDVAVSLTVVPLLDMHGVPAVNEDGTFYPCDRFEIAYSIELTSGDSSGFDEIKISYDSSAFNMFSNSSAFGVARVGGGYFEVLSSAKPGTYSFFVEVWGNRLVDDTGAESYVLAKAAINIEVVEYDPHFVLNLAYTIPSTNSSSSNSSNGGGGSSFEKPFVLIVRYDGNGPDFNLRQRAVIDDYFWSGYAQKMPELDAMQQTLTPNLTVADFFNQTSNVQFLAQGIPNDGAKFSQPIVSVDETSFQSSALPKTFFWETNSNHTYIWTQTLSETDTPSGSLTGLYEWFEWQLCLVFPPSLNGGDGGQGVLSQTNQTLIQEALQNQLSEQFNSRNGTLTVNQFGNTITAMYAHNKLLENFAQEAGVARNKTLQCLTQMPLYFNAQERYAKIQYQLDQAVVNEVVAQNFTAAICYNVSLGCGFFGKPVYFEANFTAQYEFFDKLFNATAYKWNPLLQQWGVDSTVSIRAVFGSAFNFTETDLLRSEFEEQTSDPIALKLAMDDLYDSGPQTFSGVGGVVEANLKRTSPLYYSLRVEAGQQASLQQRVFLERTVQLSFRDNTPYVLPLNFDSTSPLQVNVTADGAQSALLSLDAPVELGGLTNVTVYLITKAPQGKSLSELSKSQFDLKLLRILNVTSPQEQVQAPVGYNDKQNVQQFYQYYTGYSSVFDEGCLGFWGQTQIVVQKDQNIIALTSQGEALLYVEATNIWGTSFHQIVPIQPYSKPHWDIPFNEVTIYLVALVVIAIIVSFLVYRLKTK